MYSSSRNNNNKLSNERRKKKKKKKKKRSKALIVLVHTKLSCNLYQLSHGTNRARLARVLVPDNSFRNTLRLYLGRTKLLQLGQSDEAALEIKRHVRRRHVPRCSADIVEQACQRPRFEKRARLPVWQVLRDNLVTWFAVLLVSFWIRGRVKW